MILTHRRERRASSVELLWAQAQRPTPSPPLWEAQDCIIPWGRRPRILELSLCGSNIGSFSFIWGSIDTFNFLTLITAGALHGYNYSGSCIAGLIPTPANGSQTLNPQNPIVTFLLSVSIRPTWRLRLNSSQNAFEIDDIADQGSVPEPSTWAMMLLGFGAIAFTIRRRKSANTLTQLA